MCDISIQHFKICDTRVTQYDEENWIETSKQTKLGSQESESSADSW